MYVLTGIQGQRGKSADSEPQHQQCWQGPRSRSEAPRDSEDRKLRIIHVHV
jgi:hypothetical protein